jgi:nucleoside-diphosphate-sugar epimerase
LKAQARFDDAYNSSNIEAIEGRHYDLVVCAGAPGAKWKANRDPEADRAALDRLMRSLSRVSADHVVLISTVDVYPLPIEVDEETPIVAGECSPYGRHRLLLEHLVRERFAATVVRLPGLFGAGLKKNVIFDFLNDNQLDAIHPESRFQFYSLARLWEDIELARKAGLVLVNFATAPTSVRSIAREAFGFEFENSRAPAPVRYDMRTRHAEIFGRRGDYLRVEQEVFRELREFVLEARKR